ncbi:bifunctional lytic transglycosylase/C40 family peptidase [Streptomyces sp. NPDC003077]|uniref:C40 family peptidase n=1 Tax=Streptomyces sp. NPDC003077 TaxID=3154443 RepID=UPI0033AAD764
MATAVKAVLGITAGALLLTLLAVSGATGLTNGTASGPPASGTAPSPSRKALQDIPYRMLALYRRAAAVCPGLPWTVLAAIGKTETDHARHPHMISTAGAIGPMQFLPTTFRAYAHPVPPGGHTPPTPWDPIDATYAAARLLCAHGARHGHDLPGAIHAYNHDHAYVDQVLRTAATYGARDRIANPGGRDRPPTPQAALAIIYARNQLGRPYVWGGEGPTRNSIGFDCSGLTQAAYAAAGTRLPRTAHDQYRAGPHIPDHARLLPGDLVFYGAPTHVHHVGLYVGAGRMINAPRPRHTVREEPFRFPGDDYLGATRPTLRP